VIRARPVDLDVVENIKCIIQHVDPRLTVDERSLLSVAYKMLSNDLRTALRLTARIGKQAMNKPRQVALVELQCRRIEKELVDVCQDVVRLLNDDLMPHATLGEEKVFYSFLEWSSLRLGDYYRYLAESCKEEKEQYTDQSLLSYKMAYRESLRGMDPLHPTRLGVALNFAVFFHDCKNSSVRACHLAKHALDEAVEALENYKGTDSLHDSFVILQFVLFW
jgi:14-3-3 protein epsilon